VPEVWLVGGALGFLASSLVASVLYRFELGAPAAVVTSAFVLIVAGVLAARTYWRGRGAAAGELRWLALTWLFVVGVVALPFAHVGARVADGLAYRAYFSADLMTHLSVVAELQKGAFPLQNPFYAGETLGYYWLFFGIPAALGAWVGNQSALIGTYVVSGLLFSGLVFTAARRLELSPPRAFFATTVLIGAVSYEGLVALLRKEPWTDINVDALARWVFDLVSLDGLHRGILYTPQHLFSYSLLVILILLVLSGEPRRPATAVLAGVTLGGMAGTSIVTAMLAGPWLVLVLWRRRRDVAFVKLSFVATATSLVFLAWYVGLGFFGDAGAALTWRVPSLLEVPSILLLDCGALVSLVWLARRRLDPDLLLLSGIALLALLFLDLRGYEGVWMAWRAGSVLLVALGVLAFRELGKPLRLTHALILVPAVLTLGLDVYNASDVTNRRPSPGGFPWTTVVRSDEGLALSWVRAETRKDALVQWDVRARELGEWALVPALAERRMAVGFPIFLLDQRKYRVRESWQVRPIFNAGDASEAYRLARELGIDYIIIGDRELEVRGERLRPLFEAKDLFRPAFEAGDVAVLEVLVP